MSRAAAAGGGRGAAEGPEAMPAERSIPKADGGMPQAPRSSDVNAVISNTALSGDIVNGNSEAGELTVTLENATLTGAVTTASVEYARGPGGEEITMQTPHLYPLIGEVKNTYCATGNANGAAVSVDKKSKWIVDKTAYLKELSIAKKGTVTAPDGYSVTMTVDGAKTPLRAGTYKGQIVLEVKKDM
jgi:hypothetical protein